MLTTALGALIFIAIPAVLLLEVVRCAYLELRKDRIPILLYHRLLAWDDVQKGMIADDEMIWVSYDKTFSEQMSYLAAEGYTTLDFDDYLSIRSGDLAMPARPVLITFDDGYLSNYRFAFPVLRQHNQKATIFVPPEPDEYTRKKIERVDGFVNVEQMREMSDGNVSIQSHTLTHCVLDELDDASVMYELVESKARLSRITNRPVQHIAIPRSGYSCRISKLVAEAGYKTACCNNKGTATGLSTPLALPRIVIERDMTLDDFVRCLTPRGALALRIVGNLKRIPERIGGSGLAMKVRSLLYSGPLRPLFETRRLKRVAAVFGLFYVLGSVAFIWHLVNR